MRFWQAQEPTLTQLEEQPQPTSWHLIGGVLLACALTRLVLGALTRENPPVKPMPAAELPSLRLTEGRLAGQTSYAPYPTRPDHRNRLLFAKFASDAGSPRDRAYYHLLIDDLDRAVADMEEAVQTSPGEASLLSDLSALYDERARAKNRPEDYVAALEMAERAAAVGPDLPEATFNRALALEHLFLRDKALDVWDRYFDDFDSPWNHEAEEHSRRLRTENSESFKQRYPPLLQRIADRDEKAIVRLTAQNPQEAREIFEADLLPKWAEAVARGQDDQASFRLAGARQIAETLAAHGGNRIFLRIVAEMEAVAAEPPSRRQGTTLIQALRRYQAGRDKLSIGSFTEAMADFMAAELSLRSIGSAAELIVSLQKTFCQLRNHEPSSARASLARLGLDPRLRDYPSLEAWRQVYLAYLARKAENPNDALASYHRALDFFRALGETSNVAQTQNQIASILESLGQSAEAWRYRYYALAWTRGLPGDKFGLHSTQKTFYGNTALEILEDAAMASLAQRRPEAALQLQSRAVFLAEICQRPEDTASALLTRARIEAALGRRVAAGRDFRGALNILPSMQDRARKLLASRIEMVRSEIADAEGRAAAIASERFAPEHLDRAELDFRRGDTTAGEKSLNRALDELEQRRAKVASGNYRVSFFDQAWPIYERMVALEVHMAQPEKALEVLERFRARALLDQLGRISAGRTGVAPMEWRDLYHRLPDHTVLPVYAVVEGRLVTWLVKSSRIWMPPQQPEWSTVSVCIRRLREPRVEESERKELLKQLYEWLVAPWKKELNDGDRIIFVPTAELYRVPFAALLNQASGKFLIEDHAVGVAPSVSEFVTAVDRDHRTSPRPFASVLLVGDPGRSDDGLPPLPGSVREIQLLSHLYRGLDVRVLTQAQATPKRVLASMGKADIVHLAVHAMEDFKDPMRSRLLLSSHGSDSGELSARDLLRVHLPRTHLVVLAACGSHAGPVSDSEGSLSLAHSFLAAGVPAVVGSLWLVADESTSRLSVRFHQELLRGTDALMALRAAQLEEVAAHPTDWTWAGFQVYGGVEERVP